MIRLVDPQGMETFPENDYPFIEVENVFDGLRYVSQDSDVYRRERHDPKENWHEWFREIAWSRTVTTEPPIVSRGYVLPMWATKIDGLTLEILTAHFAEIYLLDVDGDLLEPANIGVYAPSPWALDEVKSDKHNIVGFYIAQPLQSITEPT